MKSHRLSTIKYPKYTLLLSALILDSMNPEKSPESQKPSLICGKHSVRWWNMVRKLFNFIGWIILMLIAAIAIIRAIIMLLEPYYGPWPWHIRW